MSGQDQGKSKEAWKSPKPRGKPSLDSTCLRRSNRKGHAVDRLQVEHSSSRGQGQTPIVRTSQRRLSAHVSQYVSQPVVAGPSTSSYLPSFAPPEMQVSQVARVSVRDTEYPATSSSSSSFGVVGTVLPNTWYPISTNIRDLDGSNPLWKTDRLLLTVVSANRKLSLGNELFAQSLSQKNGDIIFHCKADKMVRVHSVLLAALLPKFVEQLQTFHQSYLAFGSGGAQPLVPVIPLFVKGVEAKIMDNFLHFLNNGNTIASGQETLVYKTIIEAFNLEELSVHVHPQVVAGGGAGLSQSSSLPYSNLWKQNYNQLGVNSRMTMSAGMGPAAGPAEEEAMESQDEGQAEEDGDKEIMTSGESKRAVYSKQLKMDIMSALQAGKPVKDLAKRYDIPNQVISRWKYTEKRKSAGKSGTAGVADSSANATTTEEFQPEGAMGSMMIKLRKEPNQVNLEQGSGYFGGNTALALLQKEYGEEKRYQVVPQANIIMAMGDGGREGNEGDGDLNGSRTGDSLNVGISVEIGGSAQEGGHDNVSSSLEQ